MFREKKPSERNAMYWDKPKLGRNDACWCGSGKKYKKCCMQKDKANEM